MCLRKDKTMDMLLHPVVASIAVFTIVAVCTAVSDFFKKDYDTSDIRQSIVAAVAVRFAIEILDTTASLAEGTVYTVVTVVADGFDCPRTFLAIYLFSLVTHPSA